MQAEARIAGECASGDGCACVRAEIQGRAAPINVDAGENMRVRANVLIPNDEKRAEMLMRDETKRDTNDASAKVREQACKAVQN